MQLKKNNKVSTYLWMILGVVAIFGYYSMYMTTSTRWANYKKDLYMEGFEHGFVVTIDSLRSIMETAKRDTVVTKIRMECSDTLTFYLTPTNLCYE